MTIDEEIKMLNNKLATLKLIINSTYTSIDMKVINSIQDRLYSLHKQKFTQEIRIKKLNKINEQRH